MNVEAFDHPMMIEIGGRLSYVNAAITTVANPKGTVLCLHEFTAHGAVFQPFADQLAALGWKVVAPDMPGRGKSQRLPSDLYTWHTYLHVLAAVLRLHGQGPLVILGVGWGAMLAVGLENVWRPQPAKLVLCDLPVTWQFSRDPRAEMMAQLCTIVANNDDDFLSQVRHLTQTMPELRADVLRDVLRRLMGPKGARSLGTDPKVFDTLPRDPKTAFSCQPLLRACRTPTDMFFGGRSPTADESDTITAQNHHITARRLGVETFCDWSDPVVFLALREAIQSALTLDIPA